MKNNQFFKRFVAIFLAFITVLSFSSQVFAMSVSDQQIREIRNKLKEGAPWELAISDLCLTVGDFIQEYLVFLLKDEVTVQKIIYNKVDALNANFFRDDATGETSSKAPASAIIVEMINSWYSLLGKIVIIVYMVALVAVGLRTILRWRWSEGRGPRVACEVDNGNRNIFPFPIFNEVFI